MKIDSRQVNVQFPECLSYLLTSQRFVSKCTQFLEVHYFESSLYAFDYVIPCSSLMQNSASFQRYILIFFYTPQLVRNIPKTDNMPFVSQKEEGQNHQTVKFDPGSKTKIKLIFPKGFSMVGLTYYWYLFTNFIFIWSDRSFVTAFLE